MHPQGGIWRYLALSAYWFGFSFHWFLLLPLLMPADVERFVGAAQKGTYLGYLAGTLALIPLVLPPFIGAWSDRVGRRLPFLVWGTAVNVLGLLVMWLAPGYWVYALGYVLVQLGNSVASSPYAALIPDVVPEGERGSSSGALAFLQLSSQIAGGVAAFALGGSRTGQFMVIILFLVLCTYITLVSVREPGVVKPGDHRIPWRVYFEPQYRDFRWVFLTRAFTETGRFAVQPFLLFYLTDVVRTFRLGSWDLKEPQLALTLLLVALSLTAAVTAIIGGPRSDRIGKKPIIYFAGAVMAVAALGFMLTQNYAVAALMGLVFGMGYGAYVSVDWALATSVLPDALKHARDMGVWHIALVFPQLFQGLFGQLLDRANKASENSGYALLFGIAIGFFVLGTVFVSRIRGVR
jgi:MFS family permease